MRVFVKLGPWRSSWFREVSLKDAAQSNTTQKITLLLMVNTMVRYVPYLSILTMKLFHWDIFCITLFQHISHDPLILNGISCIPLKFPEEI